MRIVIDAERQHVIIDARYEMMPRAMSAAAAPRWYDSDDDERDVDDSIDADEHAADDADARCRREDATKRVIRCLRAMPSASNIVVIRASDERASDADERTMLRDSWAMPASAPSLFTQHYYC